VFRRNCPAVTWVYAEWFGDGCRLGRDGQPWVAGDPAWTVTRSVTDLWFITVSDNLGRTGGGQVTRG
jgi:hypothetical protein